MRKILHIFLSILLILAPLNHRVDAQSGSIDLESRLSLKHDSMISGEDNHLLIALKTTGPKTVIKDLSLRLSFDESVIVNRDFLAANVPEGIAYELSENTLQLSAEELEAGKFYEIPFLFKFPNGLTEDASFYEFKLEGESQDHSLSEQSVSVTVNASSPLKINKDYQGLAEESLGDSLGIAPGLRGKWHTKAHIPKSDYGQMFIQEGSEIVIVEEFDHEILEYYSVDGIKEPDLVEEGRLVWRFEAPSYEEQSASQDLFFKEFDVIYRVKEDLVLDEKLDDIGAKAHLSFSNIKGEFVEDEDLAQTSIYPSAEDTPEVFGQWWIPGHFGPENAFGEHSIDFEAMNTRPTVYEWAKLQYAHQIVALDYGENNVYKSYDISYFINDYLILDEIKTPGRFMYRPNSEHGDATYLEKQPTLDVLFYDQEGNLLKHFENIGENQVIQREEILEGFDPETQIAKVVYSITDFIPGMIVDEPDVNPKTGVTDLPTYTFSINPSWKEDAVDGLYELKNEKMIEVERAFPISYKEVYDFRDGVEHDYIIDFNGGITKEWVGWHFLSAPRWAIVTESEETYVPTITNPIEILNHRDGIVYPGSNTLRLMLKNEEVSNGAVLENVFSYFVLPKTITMDLAEVENVELVGSNAYYHIYQVQWQNEQLIPREFLKLEIPVHIDDAIASLQLAHYSHLPENEDFKVLKVDNPVIQDSLKVNRPDKLSDYLDESDLVLSRNYYKVLSDYRIEVEKFVKASSDDDFKKTTSMKDDELLTYRLDFRNQKGVEIDRFALMDILPHQGDQGITNFVERGSEFNLSLSGPIQMDDRFEVFYASSQNPSRAILNNFVDQEQYLAIEGGEDVKWLKEDEVEDWEEIYSFVVILKEGEKIAMDENFSLVFTTKIPKGSSYESDVYAHNSFALTANASPLIEPLQVSVKLDVETSPTPEDPTPEDPTPKDPTPEDPTPEDPTPEDPTPKDPTPKDPTPKDPTPKDPMPEDPTPKDPRPEEPKIEDPKKEVEENNLPATGQASYLSLSVSLVSLGIAMYLKSLLQREE